MCSLQWTLFSTQFSHSELKRKPNPTFEILIQILHSVKQFKIAFREGGRREGGGLRECGLVLGDCCKLKQHGEGKACFLIFIAGNLI